MTIVVSNVQTYLPGVQLGGSTVPPVPVDQRAAQTVRASLLGD